MALLEWRNAPDINGLKVLHKSLCREGLRQQMPTADALLKSRVAENVDEHIKVKKQKTKQKFDKHAKQFPELEIGESVRLQPTQPKNAWSIAAEPFFF